MKDRPPAGTSDPKKGPWWLTARLGPLGFPLVLGMLRRFGAGGGEHTYLGLGLLRAITRFQHVYRAKSVLADEVRLDVLGRLVDLLEAPPSQTDSGVPRVRPATQASRRRRERFEIKIPLQRRKEFLAVRRFLAVTNCVRASSLGRSLTALALAVVVADDEAIRCWPADELDQLFGEVYGTDPFGVSTGDGPTAGDSA